MKETSTQSNGNGDANTLLKKYPWETRWLKGHEYLNLITNYKEYSNMFGFQISKNHPLRIYEQPDKDGSIYFLSNLSLKQFGFPRIPDLKKKCKWKKMNFTTNLPKNNPSVTYIVATGTIKRKLYRMHIVIPYDGKYKSLILGNKNDEDSRYNMDYSLNKYIDDEEKRKKYIYELYRKTKNTHREVILCHILRIGKMKNPKVRNHTLNDTNKTQITNIVSNHIIEYENYNSSFSSDESAKEYYEKDNMNSSNQDIKIYNLRERKNITLKETNVDNNYESCENKEDEITPGIEKVSKIRIWCGDETEKKPKKLNCNDEYIDLTKNIKHNTQTESSQDTTNTNFNYNSTYVNGGNDDSWNNLNKFIKKDYNNTFTQIDHDIHCINRNTPEQQIFNSYFSIAINSEKNSVNYKTITREFSLYKEKQSLIMETKANRECLNTFYLGDYLSNFNNHKF